MTSLLPGPLPCPVTSGWAEQVESLRRDGAAMILIQGAFSPLPARLYVAYCPHALQEDSERQV
jgi:hypothetical protein